MERPIRVGNPYLPQPIQHNRIVNKHKVETTPFSQVLTEEISKSSPLTISHHAEQRMLNRGIQMSGELMHRLEGAVDKATTKGSRDALVILDNLAFVVSVKNRTVITAMDEESMRNNVFTNIDSAVFN